MYSFKNICIATDVVLSYQKCQNSSLF
ncbi:hypothetical protein [African swine fever virus]